ncbi:MAG: CPBP family intramembrane metalloprotease [Cyclobacteriaceae bacterium]|nr:CPBP family intramembrane metalloprotease [Cyclobacteriaceae bacterium]
MISENSFLERSDFLLITRISLLIIIVESIVIFIYNSFEIQLENEVSTWPWYFELPTGVIFAPIFESWLCQYLPFNLFKRFIKEVDTQSFKVFYLLSTGIFFGLLHSDTIWYMFYGLLAGLGFSYCFYRFKLIYPDSYKPLLFTSLTHSIVNLLVFITSIIYNLSETNFS